MHTPISRPAALLGTFLTGLAALCCAVGAPGAADKLVFSLGLLFLAGLSLLLLRHEGFRGEDLARFLLPIGLALLLRALFLPHATLDYQDFLSKWVDHFRQNGGFAALKDPIGNYNVPYLYFLAAFSRLPLSDLYLIKFLSMTFDILLAWGALRLVRALGGDVRRQTAAFSALLLLPTVILNGACWGQCDSIWAALCVLALEAALSDRPGRSAALLALAFSFKLQAIFILPLWGGLWLLGRVKFRHLLLFPAAFALTMVPALLLGKPVGDILGVYLGQASSSASYPILNYNSPSVFALLPYHWQAPDWASRAAIMLAFLFVLAVLALLVVRRRQADNAALALAGAALSLGVPFLLPYMHERYFFLGGVLLAALACLHPSRLPAAAGAEAASLGGYHAYLRRRYVLPLTLFGVTWSQLIEGCLMLFALLSLLTALCRRLFSPDSLRPPGW